MQTLTVHYNSELMLAFITFKVKSKFSAKRPELYLLSRCPKQYSTFQNSYRKYRVRV